MLSAVASYRPGFFDGDITVFGSKERIGYLGDRKPGWSALARRSKVTVIGDAHMDMFTGLLPVLGAELRRALHQAQAGAP